MNVPPVAFPAPPSSQGASVATPQASAFADVMERAVLESDVPQSPGQEAEPPADSSPQVPEGQAPAEAVVAPPPFTVPSSPLGGAATSPLPGLVPDQGREVMGEEAASEHPGRVSGQGAAGTVSWHAVSAPEELTMSSGADLPPEPSPSEGISPTAATIPSPPGGGAAPLLAASGESPLQNPAGAYQESSAPSPAGTVEPGAATLTSSASVTAASRYSERVVTTPSATIGVPAGSTYSESAPSTPSSAQQSTAVATAPGDRQDGSPVAAPPSPAGNEVDSTALNQAADERQAGLLVEDRPDHRAPAPFAQPQANLAADSRAVSAPPEAAPSPDPLPQNSVLAQLAPDPQSAVPHLGSSQPAPLAGVDQATPAPLASPNTAGGQGDFPTLVVDKGSAEMEKAVEASPLPGGPATAEVPTEASIYSSAQQSGLSTSSSPTPSSSALTAVPSSDVPDLVLAAADRAPSRVTVALAPEGLGQVTLNVESSERGLVVTVRGSVSALESISRTEIAMVLHSRGFTVAAVDMVTQVTSSSTNGGESRGAGEQSATSTTSEDDTSGQRERKGNNDEDSPYAFWS